MNRAEADLPGPVLALLRHQSSLAAAEEKRQRHQLGQFQFDDDQVARLNQYHALFQQFKTVHRQTGFQYQNHQQAMDNLLAQLDAALSDQDELLQ